MIITLVSENLLTFFLKNGTHYEKKNLLPWPSVTTSNAGIIFWLGDYAQQKPTSEKVHTSRKRYHRRKLETNLSKPLFLLPNHPHKKNSN